MADDLPEGWEKRQSRSTVRTRSEMSDEVVDLQRRLRTLEGHVLGYSKIEDILKKKSDTLTATVIENKILRKKLQEATELQTRAVPRTVEHIGSAQEERDTSASDNVELDNRTGSLASRENLDNSVEQTVDEIKQVNDAENNSVYDRLLTEMMSNKMNLDESAPAECSGNSKTVARDDVRKLEKEEIVDSDFIVSDFQHVECSVYKPHMQNRISEVPSFDSVERTGELADRVNRTSSSSSIDEIEFISEVCKKPLERSHSDSFCVKDDNLRETGEVRHSPPGLLNGDVVSRGHMECETSGVHLVSRSSGSPGVIQFSEIEPHFEVHKYVNVELSANPEFHFQSKKVNRDSYDLPPTCDKLIDQSKAGHDRVSASFDDRKLFEISLSEGSDSHLGERLVSLLKCMDNLEEECSVHRERIVALEKENKYLRKLNYHQKILKINVDTPDDVFVQNGTTIAGQSSHGSDADLATRYLESQDTIKELNSRLVTMNDSVQQILQHGNINLASKDKALKDLKKKFIEERTRCLKLSERLAKKGKESGICPTCDVNHNMMRNVGPPSVAGRNDSIVVNDLLTEISVLHQQMVVLAEDFRAERKDKSRIKSSQDDIQKKLSEVRSHMVKLQVEMQSSENNLHEALKRSDKLQERLEAQQHIKSRKPLPTVPQSNPHTSPPSLLLGESASTIPGSWGCNSCTYLNHPQRTVCDICGLLKKPPRPTKHRELSPTLGNHATDQPRIKDNTNRNSAISKNGSRPSGNSPVPNITDSSINGISPLSEQSAVWDVQEEQLRMLTPYSKPYRLVPRNSSDSTRFNCDMVAPFLQSKSF